MKRHNIPTAEFKCFTDFEAANNYLINVEHRVVIKVFFLVSLLMATNSVGFWIGIRSRGGEG